MENRNNGNAPNLADDLIEALGEAVAHAKGEIDLPVLRGPRYWISRTREYSANGRRDYWVEVDRATWIKAEREAGFHPKHYGVAIPTDDPRYWTICATGGFGFISGSVVIDGKITRPDVDPNDELN